MGFFEKLFSDHRFLMFIAGLAGYGVSHFFGFIQAPEWLQEHQEVLAAVREIADSLIIGENGG